MSTQKKVRILSIDGGGIRGIIPATILQYVEAYLQKKVPDTTISDHFDMVAGTSTGGILTGIYLTPQKENYKKAKYTASEALDFYIKEGYTVFNAAKNRLWKRFWGLGNATEYCPQNFEKALQEKFGNLRMSELLEPCLITAYDMKTKAPYFFTSTEDTTKREFLVRDVIRSTCAAPTYFPPAKIKNRAAHFQKGSKAAYMLNIDGGVFANNPVMCAYAEARNTNFKERHNNEPAANEMQILSIGTGGGGFTINRIEKSSSWSLLKWAKLIPDIMMDGSIDAVAYQMNEIYQTLAPTDSGSYLRINTPEQYRNYSSKMSDATPENIEKLLQAGEQTLNYAIANGLNPFLDQLLE